MELNTCNFISLCLIHVHFPQDHKHWAEILGNIGKQGWCCPEDKGGLRPVETLPHTSPSYHTDYSTQSSYHTDNSTHSSYHTDHLLSLDI